MRTGVDLIEIARFESQNAAIRQRFLHRIFTPEELKENGSSSETVAELFAAKEAISKALGSGIGLISWHEIEILGGLEREPIIRLNGKAKDLAEKASLYNWSISISHTATHAIAMVVAEEK
jgi:holo-[acyl-carrier protein] synthase